jgi:hypothetical protein
MDFRRQKLTELSSGNVRTIFGVYFFAAIDEPESGVRRQETSIQETK